ncbi:hypothetical protein [Arenibacter sp. 6A1]|uniref:hypothetical protein n=1 Tax=Arenibacter sp. 6A1 TaxID=2720391 RepID=UPI0014465A89|nr:hypothetical protein [Arenibacter sp. 6A1]
MYPIQQVAAVPGISTLKLGSFPFPIIFGVSILIMLVNGVVVNSASGVESGISQKTNAFCLFNDIIDKEVQYGIR